MAGESVQVLFVEEDGTYRLDETALRRVAEHEAARGLPVAVASVAGATRGGKSFLLDFFLRYLRAPEAARRSGAWLGADHDPLTGFSWRGGWKRNTTGILLWSEPVIVTQEVNGHSRKIAVLLMDTQGTFDNDSTVKDSTTIFAISTLISSLQIYNLSQVIKEDDLHHLQLFTEYGKLARTEEDVKPFQALMFRVRDWMFPYEHPYGAQGGESYLKTVLQAQTNNKEIQNLREYIRSSFKTVSCFLTPHPGMAIEDQNFNGRICDVLPKFRESLLEFVPLLFQPSKLNPKIINGHEVKLEELPTYFRTYIEMFNQRDLPTPVSIFEATRSAGLQVALLATREEYCSYMERSTGGEGRLPRGALLQLHSAALDAARATFAARKILGDHAASTARLNALLLELDAMLPNYVAVNHAKILAAVIAARAAYLAAVSEACGGRPLCLHPRDVPELHAEASAAAMERFGASRQTEKEEKEDLDRKEMLQWLDGRGQEMQASNDANNTAARVSASALYGEMTARSLRTGALGAERVRLEHGTARDAAVQALRDARVRPSLHSDDEDCYMTELIRNIEEQFRRWESWNSRGCQWALRDAVATYDARVTRGRGVHVCLHPRALRREHAAAREDARAALRAYADGGENEVQLEQMLEERYAELTQMNEASNAVLVTAAYGEYSRRMEVKCAPSLTSLALVPWLLKVLVQLPQYHGQFCVEAIAYFHSRRRSFGDEDEGDDEYLDRLKTKLADGYDVYCNPLRAIARELNLPISGS